MDTSCLKNKKLLHLHFLISNHIQTYYPFASLVGQEVCCLCLNWFSSSIVLGTWHKMRQQSSLIHAKHFKG